MRHLLVFTLVALWSVPLVAQEREVIQLGGAGNLPFSTAVKVGNLIFLSGQIGTQPGQGLVPGGIGPETRQTLTNIKNALEQIGSSMDRVVKCTVFLADIADYQAMNAVYREFFPAAPPARSTLAAGGLVLNARIEIECIAVAA